MLCTLEIDILNVKRLISSIEINYSFDEQIKICYFINKSIFLSQKKKKRKKEQFTSPADVPSINRIKSAAL